MKKFLSLILALTMVLSMGVSVFAETPLTTVAATEAALSVYTQAGAFAKKVLVKSYTAKELNALAQKKADGYGYQYFKGDAEQAVVATEFVTLDALLTDANVTFAENYTIKFTCSDGEYTKYTPDYADIQEGKYFWKDGASEEVPAALAISWTNGNLADGTVADYAAKATNSGSLRFVIGTTEADYTSQKAAGKRMPSGVVAITVVDDTKGFTDLSSAHWGYDAIVYAVQNGFFKGNDDNTFAPDDIINMAQAVCVLFRINGGTETAASGAWYTQFSEWAIEKSVTDAASFKAEQGLKREQFINMLYKTLALDSKYDTTVTDEMKATLKTATDYASIDASCADAIAWAVKVGLISGTSADTLTVDPLHNITRAEVCTILNRYYSNLAK